MRYWVDCVVNRPFGNLYLNSWTIKAFAYLEASMVKKDYSEALRAVHTLKGICQNLSFTRLFESSSLTTTALKQNDWNKAVDMMPQLSNDYYEIVDIIRAYKNSGEE